LRDLKAVDLASCYAHVFSYVLTIIIRNQSGVGHLLDNVIEKWRINRQKNVRIAVRRFLAWLRNVNTVVNG